MLRACASAWDSALRGEDTIVRFGGEEFLVLLPDTAPEQAAEIVERLRAATPMGQTCSAGLACWDCGESIDDLLRRADEALYLAKAERPRPAARRRSSPAEPVMIRGWAATEHERAVRFRTARRDPELTVVEGFHALKHALRFGAELVEAVAVDPRGAGGDGGRPGARPGGAACRRGSSAVDEETLAELVPLVPHTGVVAIARRPPVDLAAALADPAPAPAVLLEQPRNMGNIGACVRVAAAAGAAALLTTGENDPWHPDAVRGAAGLQFALPVAGVEALPASDRPLLAIDPDGEELAPERCPPRRPRLRHRAPRAQRRGLRARRRPDLDPDARGRLQPQPRHLGRGRPLRDEVENYGCSRQERRIASGIHRNAASACRVAN